MLNRRNTLAILLLSALLALMPFAILAQESTEPAPVVTEEPIPVLIVDSPSEEGTSSDSSPALPEAFSGILFAFPLVIILTGFLKHYIKGISAGTLNFSISLVVFVAYTIAKQNGLGVQFEAFTGGDNKHRGRGFQPPDGRWWDGAYERRHLPLCEESERAIYWRESGYKNPRKVVSCYTRFNSIKRNAL